MCFVSKHAVFTLFALTLIIKRCNASPTGDTGDEGQVDTGDEVQVDTGDVGQVDTGDEGQVDTGDGEEMAKNVQTPKPTKVMDKLEDFNMTYYCKFQANDIVCNSRKISRKYFFDVKLAKCREFDYGFCDHSYNMFEGRRICQDVCRDDAIAAISDNVTANVYCRYQPDFGECNLYYPSFYFDISERKCKGFAYSGCGGNRNRFSSAVLCSDVCENAVRHKQMKL